MIAGAVPCRRWMRRRILSSKLRCRSGCRQGLESTGHFPSPQTRRAMCEQSACSVQRAAGSTGRLFCLVGNEAGRFGGSQRIQAKRGGGRGRGWWSRRVGKKRAPPVQNRLLQQCSAAKFPACVKCRKRSVRSSCQWATSDLIVRGDLGAGESRVLIDRLSLGIKLAAWECDGDVGSATCGGARAGLFR